MSPHRTTALRFDARHIRLGCRAEDWGDAVRQAGGLLNELGVTAPAYTQRMVDVVRAFGPYIVVAEGAALAHARPGRDVRENGAVLLTFPEGVRFGHPDNDPVRVVIAVAVTEADAHVAVVAAVANLLDEHEAAERILRGRNPETMADRIAERLGAFVRVERGAADR